jgi:hypothetical protein
MTQESRKQTLSSVLSNASSITIGDLNVIKAEVPPVAPQLVRLVTAGPNGEVAYLADHSLEVQIDDGKILVPMTIEGTGDDELIEVELYVTRRMTVDDVLRGVAKELATL